MRSTVAERLGEDPQFSLSISVPHVEGHEEHEDLAVDGPIYDDDLALSATTLIEGLETSVVQGVSLENDQEAILSFNANGDLEFHGGFDDQLTDDDADGETDPEPEHDSDDFVELAETQPRDVDENFEESDGFRDASITLVDGTLPDLSAEGEHNMQDADGRYVFFVISV
jgi:hypothetical protein